MPTDHFSNHAADYAQHRPTYPPELFAYLANLCPRRERAWDCGTGNGQAAAALAAYFARVDATDISEQQLAEAPALPNVHYRVLPAEATDFPDQVFDLVTVAQALHWFDHPAFFREVRRVARPGALFAAWGYGLLTVDADVDPHLRHFYHHIIGPYWDAARRHVDAAYRSIPFPFAEIETPEFVIERRWTRAKLLDYIRTWSSVKNYERQHGRDPVALLSTDLENVWEEEESRRVLFPLFMRVGRV